jgi:tetratricopeptide (TPR) repeat protein
MVSLLQKEFAGSINYKRASGEMLLWKGDTAAAIAAFESLTEKNEYDWYALASIYLARCEGSRAEAAMSHLSQAPQWDDARKQSKAKVAFCKGNYDEALEVMKEQNSNDFTARYNMALAAYNAGKYQVAMELGANLVAEATGEDKKNLCRIIGNSAVKQKDWKASRSWFMQLTGFDTDDALSFYNVAVADYNLGDMEESWKYYQESRKLKPSMKNADIEKRYAQFKESPRTVVTTEAFEPVDSLYNSAVDYQQKKKTNEARKLYASIVKIDSTYYRAWNNLGAIYGAEGELEKAVECYEKVVSQKKDIPDGYVNLINVFIALKDYHLAQKWILRGKMTIQDTDVFASMERKLQKARQGKR